MTTRRTRIACWITKSTNTHSHYVIFIAFPIHQLLPERPSTFRHSKLPNTCLSQLLSDPKSIYIRPLRYRCSGKMQHVSAFCLWLFSASCCVTDVNGLKLHISVCVWVVCVCVCMCVYLCVFIYIQGVPGGMCQTSGGCSLC